YAGLLGPGLQEEPHFWGVASHSYPTPPRQDGPGAVGQGSRGRGRHSLTVEGFSGTCTFKHFSPCPETCTSVLLEPSLDPGALRWPWTECAQLTEGIRPRSQQALEQGLASCKRGPCMAKDDRGGHRVATARDSRSDPHGPGEGHSVLLSSLLLGRGSSHLHRGEALGAGPAPWHRVGDSSWSLDVLGQALGTLPCKSPVNAMQAEVAGADPSPGRQH
ncbi:hypothetical protein H1C71_021156, partial [Ictidomys tridecemlineatus]